MVRWSGNVFSKNPLERPGAGLPGRLQRLLDLARDPDERDVGAARRVRGLQPGPGPRRREDRGVHRGLRVGRHQIYRSLAPRVRGMRSVEQTADHPKRSSSR